MQIKPIVRKKRLTRIDPAEGKKLAESWDFPRPILDTELDGRWSAYKDIMVTWLEPSGADDVFGIHMAVNPTMRGRGWPFLKCLDEMTTTARTRARGPGALIVCPPCDAIEPYLGRMGFIHDTETGIWVKHF